MVVFHNDIINAIAQARNIRHLLASDILERWQQGEEATAEQTQSLIQLGDWIDFLTDSEQLIVEDCIDSTDVWNIIQKIGEQAIGLDCVGTNYNYNNPPPTPTPNVFNYVESITGLNTSNADPQNPVVRISVDGTTITGDGTPASPLIASIPPSGVQSVTDDGNGVVSVDNTDPVNPIVEFNGINVDPLTLSGDGTIGSPLTVIGGGGGGVTSVSATAGAGVSVSVSNPTTTPNITVTNTDTGSAQNIFKNVAVADNSTIVADNNDDTLTLQAGTAISISTNATTDTVRIENTAPDQTVILNAGTGIGVSGTYPNFTISNTNSSNASITNTTVAGLQGLQSTSSLSTTTLYNVTNAVGNTLVLQVYAIANNTNVVYAIDVATGAIGTYNITTDTFTATTSTPDLQQVTDVDNTTTNTIISDDGAGSSTTIGNGIIRVQTGNTGNVEIDATLVTAQYTAQLPQKLAASTETFAMLSDLTGGGGITKATAAGTDTYTTTITGVTSYADGDTYLIRFTNGNTTAATLNINALGARTLYRNNDGSIIGGDIWNGAEMLCIFNSTLNGFQCIGTSPNSLFAYITNADSVTITKGQVVYAFGGQGDRMTVKLANNTSDATSARTVGVVFSASIAANQKGIIIMQGLIDGLSILPTSTYADGDSIYLGATNGAITKVKPYAPNHLVYVATVTTASNGSAGRMYVRIQNGYELDELHDVSAQTPANKDGLFYNSTTGLWVARQVSATDIDANVSNTEFGYLDGVTSSIQTQINNAGTLSIECIAGTITSPVDLATYYWCIGGTFLTASTSATGQGSKFAYAFEITGITIRMTTTTNGSAEDSTLYLRNITTSTSTLMGTFKTNGNIAYTSITGLAISCNTTDEYCLEMRSPTWATNPTNLRLTASLFLRRT